MNVFNRVTISALICIAVLACAGTAVAAIMETQQLGFGTFAMRNNNSQHDMVIEPTGGVIADPAYVVIFSGQPASFAVSGFPGSTMLIITVTPGDLTVGGSGSGEAFDLVNFQADPANPITTGAGTASFNLGATLRSSGSGSMYPDGAFEGSATVSVNF